MTEGTGGPDRGGAAGLAGGQPAGAEVVEAAGRWPVHDRWAVALAGATGVGAWAGARWAGEPWSSVVTASGTAPRLVIAVVVVLLAAGACRVLRPDAPFLRALTGSDDERRGGGPPLLGLVVCAGSAVLAAGLAQRSVAGLVPPATGPVRAEMTLVGDPAPLPGGGVRAEARHDGKHVALVAFRSAAAALDGRLAGEVVIVDGHLSPPGTFERRLPHRHLAGRVEVDVVMGWRPGHGVLHAANRVRRNLEHGAADMTDRQRSLFLGLVIGDDRAQPDDLVDAFRAAGLGHLTAVSGQNVSFALAMAAPLLRRLRLAPRLLLTLGLLAAFTLVTRGEPSVLRATGMAAVAAYGAAVGRPASGIRALAVAVTALLLADPLLATSLGFQLSVAGAAGILVGARPLRARLPGPEWFTTPLAVTLAAQLAVAPLLVTAFESVAAASIVTNLLVAPAAGPVMAWGLVGGAVAGAVGGPIAALLHVPTRCLLGWIERVALVGARWPICQLQARDLVIITVIGTGLLLFGRRLRAPAPPPKEILGGAVPGGP